MTLRLRVVLDTNALVRRLLVSYSVPGRAVRRAAADHIMLASDATIMELSDVLSRRKFDPYVSVKKRKEFLRLFGRIVEQAPILHVVRACRDPKDDKFLELAENGSAEVIVTGDADLLALNPFRAIPILTPAAFLVRVHSSGEIGSDPVVALDVSLLLKTIVGTGLR